MITQVKQQNKRYLPHELTTKVHAVKRYRQTKDVGFVLRRYHISKASLMRWNKRYDGTSESLRAKSHRPHSQHPNAHTEEELSWIQNYHRRNPNISICELYGKLRQDKAYSRHPGSLYRIFVRRAIRYFGYAPALIQTENGGEFTHTQKTDRVHPLDVLCRSLHIEHKTIRPRTPWHNGKVERSHRNDQERFYNHLKFYSYADLQLQMKRYLRRANRIPMAVLGWLSPVQKRHQLETAHSKPSPFQGEGAPAGGG